MRKLSRTEARLVRSFYLGRNTWNTCFVPIWTKTGRFFDPKAKLKHLKHLKHAEHLKHCGRTVC